MSTVSPTTLYPHQRFWTYCTNERPSDHISFLRLGKHTNPDNISRYSGYSNFDFFTHISVFLNGDCLETWCFIPWIFQIITHQVQSIYRLLVMLLPKLVANRPGNVHLQFWSFLHLIQTGYVFTTKMTVSHQNANESAWSAVKNIARSKSE